MKNTIAKISFFLLLFSLIACEEIESEIPDVPVNINININDPLYRDLKTVGNSLAVTGGHAGIIIYRFSPTEFIAYDRLCPVEQKTSCRLQETDDDLFYTCQCCETPYLMIDGTGQSVDGEKVEGTGKFLKGYRTYLSGNNLRITN